jgi:NADH-quinone oxidoreductase subunit L
MPVTFWTWILSTAALCGVPFFSGFFSKDEIIDTAHHNGYNVFFVIGLAGAFLTTAYMTRATYLTFFGAPRGAAAHFVHGDALAHDEHAMAAVDMAHESVQPEVYQEPSDVGIDHDVHHADHASKPLRFAPDDSPALLTVPLIILAAGAVVAGYLNAGFIHVEKFTEWVEPGGGEFFPVLAHATFKWVNAVPSILLVAAGFAASLFVCQAVFGERRSPLRGLTSRSRLLGAGHTFLEQKYYLDALYEKVIVHGIAHPIAQAAYWVNQKVIDGIVNGVGIGGRRTGDWVYRNIDQRLVDGAVNGSGAAARGTGTALQPVQSGKVNQYGALLFAAAAVGALVLVIVNT